ncbi:MAG: VWA domain-containing protein [Spirochaetales bacterium]|nr:VWA domain-containing protein [Spirochaetales bacterium]
MFRFETPLYFWLLLVIPVIILLYFTKKGKAGVRFSSTENVRKVPVSIRQRLSFLPLVLRVAALVFFIIALARPQEGKELVRDVSKGVAIEMVVDHSSSMSVLKDFGKKAMSRLDVVKEAFSEFVTGNETGLGGRPQDLIGMTVFARYADAVCPLTLSHGTLLEYIKNTNIVEPGSSEDGTSIGDGIAVAAAHLKKAETTFYEQSKEKESDYEIKSKVMILLTDGEDTGIGRRKPLEAAELAKEWGIKIYTIGLSGKDWYVVVNDIFGERRQRAPSNVDTKLLEEIAEATGGIFRIASDLESLRDVYKEIDTLEKSEIESFRYLDYRELFVPFAIFGLIFLAAEFILSHTLFRRIP